MKWTHLPKILFNSLNKEETNKMIQMAQKEIEGTRHICVLRMLKRTCLIDPNWLTATEQESASL
jgi:hypothetical protein